MGSMKRKDQVCKTFIQRFESAPRLQPFRVSSGICLFFLFSFDCVTLRLVAHSGRLAARAVLVTRTTQGENPPFSGIGRTRTGRNANGSPRGELHGWISRVKFTSIWVITSTGSPFHKVG